MQKMCKVALVEVQAALYRFQVAVLDSSLDPELKSLHLEYASKFVSWLEGRYALELVEEDASEKLV